MTHSASYRRILQRMGYYDYQMGIIYHHLNQEGGWNSHLENCRNFILRSFDKIRPAVITVLGSGWLLDFPLKELAEKVSVVNLVDIVHPPELKDQVSGMKNIVLREEDVTGGLIERVWQNAGGGLFFKKPGSVADIVVPDYNPDFELGMVVSLNIMTQLESLLIKLLTKKTRADKEIILRLRKDIQLSHLRFLLRHRSVLITDSGEIVTEISGRVTEIKSVLVDLPQGTDREEWIWHFETKKSDFYRKRSDFRISAILFNNEPGESKK
jgi:hypothetical protein